MGDYGDWGLGIGDWGLGIGDWDFRNCYFNLNYNRFYFYQSNKLEIMKDKEPDEMSGTIKAIPNEWTVWDFIEVNVTKTCKEVLEYLKQEYKINAETFLS